MFDDPNLDDDLTVPNERMQSDNSSASNNVTAPSWRTDDVVQSPRIDGSMVPRVTVPPPPPPIDESAARRRMRNRRTRGRRPSSDWAWVVVAAALLGVVIVVGLSVVLLVRGLREEVEIIPTAAVAELLPTPINARTDFDPAGLGLGSQLMMPDGSAVEIRPWDGETRFTMVMVGLDRRAGQTGLSYRTDTIMLISIDPIANRIGLLSIPRDLYVVVPGFAERQRVNSPMVYGENRQPGYGPQLMMQTIQNNFGIRIHDYVAVDFQSFITLVDMIGGIDINNKYTINDPQYPDLNYGYDPFYLPAGKHHLAGYDALRYARTRHGDNDFERARRQQETLIAIRDRILNLDMLPSLILQAPTLWQTLSENFYTGLSFEQIIQLVLYAKDIPMENIEMGVIDGQYIRPYSTSSGASVLIPNQARIGDLMVEIFGSNYAE